MSSMRPRYSNVKTPRIPPPSRAKMRFGVRVRSRCCSLVSAITQLLSSRPCRRALLQLRHRVTQQREILVEARHRHSARLEQGQALQMRLGLPVGVAVRETLREQIERRLLVPGVETHL